MLRISRCLGYCLRGFIVGGLTLGPIVGGAIGDSYPGWRWKQCITGIIQTIIFVLDIPILDESYPVALLATKARRLRHESGNWARHAKHEEWDVSLFELANKYLVRPSQLLFTPNYALMAIYASFCCIILYPSLAAFPIEFEEIRGWNKVIGSLPSITVFLSVLQDVRINLMNQ